MSKQSPKVDQTPESLAGKNVVVTGGTTGIGRATVFPLVLAGARVLTFGRHRKELRDAMKAFEPLNGAVHGMIADTADAGDVRNVFRQADQVLGGVDILINNAALGGGGIADTPWRDVEYTVQSNLLGYMQCVQESVKRMKRRKSGHIVNIGSTSADTRGKDSSIYVATKSGIQGFTEALHKEVSALGIRVSLIEPAATGTDMQPDTPPQQRSKEARHQMLTAEDIADCVIYCLTRPKRADVVSLQMRPSRSDDY